MSYRPLTNTADLPTDLRTVAGTDGSVIEVIGQVSKTDRNGSSFYWDAASTATDDSLTVIQVTGVTTGRWRTMKNPAIKTGSVVQGVLSLTREDGSKVKIGGIPVPGGGLASDIVGGNLSPLVDITNVSGGYETKVDDFLNGLGITTVARRDVNGSGNVELYLNLNSAGRTRFQANTGKWCKIKFYIYSKDGVMCTIGANNRLGVVGITTVVSTAAGNVTYTQVSPTVFEVSMLFLISQATVPSTFWVTAVWEAAIVPVGFVIGDLATSGLGIWYANTAIELDDSKIYFDWQPQVLTQAQGDARYVQLANEYIPNTYNNVEYNQACISKFLRKYLTKSVDSWNQITIAMAGDSIFGRQDKTVFNPASPEITVTQDTNGGIGDGYTTGHFPPNMWVQGVPFKVLQMMQYNDADVKYYNHVASEVTKSGTWTNRYPAGADNIRICESSTQNDYIQLAFTGATFCKFLYSDYGNVDTLAGTKVKVTVSDDGGSSFGTPASFGLTESESFATSGVSGEYELTDLYKWANFILSGFTAGTSYIVRVMHNDAVAGRGVPAWGFETWSNPRVNVIVVAEGGNTAGMQDNDPWRFSDSKFYRPDLVIYNLPYLNDLGGNITGYRGQVNTSTATPGSLVADDFVYCNQTGTYTNFGGLSALAGQYLQWNGSSWIPGSVKLESLIDGNYVTRNRDVFNGISATGVPVITIITHDSTDFYTVNANKKYATDYGLMLLRLMVKEYGFACIDLNKYVTENLTLASIVADGTHLNNAGVEVYRALLFELLNPLNNFFNFGNARFDNKKITGTTSSNDITFDYEFSEVPKVRLFNTTRTLDAVTATGFETTGSGSYDYEAYI